MKRVDKNIYKHPKHYNLIFILFFVLFFLCFFYFYIIYQFNASSSDDNEFLLFEVMPGESVNQISQKLENESLIKSSKLFNLYIWLKNKQGLLQAGSYELSPSQSLAEISQVLIGGKTINDEISIKILEGWSINDIEKYLHEMHLDTDNHFKDLAVQKVKNWQFSFSKYGYLENIPTNADLEGFLFPDTYRVYKDAASESIIKKMLDNFDQKITDDMYVDIKKSGKSIFDIITMASIVEKEVRDFNDMKIVSGIFWDRITNGQALESCATLAYALGENKKQYTVEDTKVNSLYNTYQNRGLPPGPICNPGINAILAAIYPDYSEYNYFLNRFDNGETVFSKTYEEHILNKNKYLR